MAATVNTGHPHSSTRLIVAADAAATSPSREADTESEWWEIIIPPKDNAPPTYKPSSAVDFLTKILQPELNPTNPLTNHWKEVFLKALARVPIATVAARVAGISRAQASAERRNDAEFARGWDNALEEGIDEIAAAAYRSAVFGEEKPVYYHGRRIGWSVSRSGAMQAMLLKALRPALFAKQGKPKPLKSTHLTLDEFEAYAEEVRLGRARLDVFFDS